MTHIEITRRCTAARRARPGLWALLRLARQRRQLAKLEDRALDDIGVTRQQARSEAARPFWDAPENWHKQLY